MMQYTAEDEFLDRLVDGMVDQYQFSEDDTLFISTTAVEALVERLLQDYTLGHIE